MPAGRRRGSEGDQEVHPAPKASGSPGGVATAVPDHYSKIDNQKVAASRLWAAKKFPYLASALFACRIISVPYTNALAVDDRWRIYIDPYLVGTWSVEEIGSMLVHHTGHLLRDHTGRALAAGVDTESAEAWITAADAEINDDLSSELQMPGTPVTPQALQMEPGKFAEEYFHELRRQKRQDPSHDCGSGGDAIKREWDQEGEGSGIQTGAAHLIRCQVASEICNLGGLEPGLVPAGLARWAEEFLSPKVDWRRVLAAEIRAGIAAVAGLVDYSYHRPSRRQPVLGDVVLPALRRPVPDVAVVCDTSGSMQDKQLTRALAEVEGILRTVGVSRSRLSVLSVDAAVHAVQKVSSARQVSLFGGGGTDMGEGLRAAAALRPKPSVVVVLTDGYTPWPSAAPKGVHVVVGLIDTGLSAAPPPAWARTVHIDEEAG